LSAARALGAATIVDEDDRRAVLAHGEQLGIDRRPDRRRVASPPETKSRSAPATARADHRLDRHVDLEVSGLLIRVDDRALRRGRP
jgi:hypothetical protein